MKKKEEKESSILVKRLKIVGIITFALIVYDLVDFAQAVILNNTPIISYKTERDDRGGRYEHGALFSTYVYCNNDKEVEIVGKVYLRSYQYKGCEGNDSAEDLIKLYINSLVEKKNYKENRDYYFLTGAIPTIEEMYYRGDFNEEQKLASAYMINGLANCDKKDKIEKWNTAEEFYNLWKDSKCRKKYMKKRRFK